MSYQRAKYMWDRVLRVVLRLKFLYVEVSMCFGFIYMISPYFNENWNANKLKHSIRGKNLKMLTVRWESLLLPILGHSTPASVLQNIFNWIAGWKTLFFGMFFNIIQHFQSQVSDSDSGSRSS